MILPHLPTTPLPSATTTTPSQVSNQRIRNPHPNNPPLSIPPLNPHTPQIPHNPIRPRPPQLPNPMRTRNSQNPKPRRLPRPHARRRIFQNQHLLPGRHHPVPSSNSSFKNPQPLRPQPITRRVRLAVLHFFRCHQHARLREVHHREPAGHQAARARCYDCPGRSEGFEVG